MKLKPFGVSVECPECKGHKFINWETIKCAKKYFMSERYFNETFNNNGILCKVCDGTGKTSGVVLAPVDWDGVSEIEINATTCESSSRNCIDCKWWIGLQKTINGFCFCEKVQKQVSDGESVHSFPDFGCIHWDKKK